LKVNLEFTAIKYAHGKDADCNKWLGRKGEPDKNNSKQMKQQTQWVSRGCFEANTYLKCSCLVLFEREHPAWCSSKRKVQSNNTQTVATNNLLILDLLPLMFATACREATGCCCHSPSLSRMFLLTSHRKADTGQTASQRS
jgi:hypothetical protein